jgi:hypothetical protein
MTLVLIVIDGKKNTHIAFRTEFGKEQITMGATGVALMVELSMQLS